MVANRRYPGAHLRAAAPGTGGRGPPPLPESVSEQESGAVRSEQFH